MERQKIKKLAMLSLVSMLTLVAAVASANAQLARPIRAKIPFDFNVGNKKLAAGEYTFGRLSGLSDPRTISISSVEGSAHTFQSTISTWLLTPKNDSTLVFHKYGDEYFLEQIWLGGEQTGGALRESRAERDLRRQMAAQVPGNNMSGKVKQPETVNIVASLF